MAYFIRQRRSGRGKHDQQKPSRESLVFPRHELPSPTGLKDAPEKKYYPGSAGILELDSEGARSELEAHSVANAALHELP